MRDETNVISVLMADHREFERMFGELNGLSRSDSAGREDMAQRLIAELMQHSVAEEQYLYPAARRRVPDGERIVRHEIDEHAEAERTMRELEDVDPVDQRFDVLVHQLADEILHHVEDEEEELFPLLQEHGDDAELRDLGREVLAAKKAAPTRPHPSMPDTPPLNKLAGAGAGLVDRLRDALTGRGGHGK